MVDLVLDTNILIDFSRGLPLAPEFILGFADQTLGVSAMTRFELIAGCRNKAELRKVERLLHRVEILKFDEPTTDVATRLLFRYRLSHGLGIADACIAASAIVRNACLATRNTSDFDFVPGLRLVAYP